MADSVKLMRTLTFTPDSQIRIAGIQFSIDSETSALPRVGKWGQQNIPFDCTITGWTLTGDQVGSAVVTVLRSSYGDFPLTVPISGTDKPTLASVQKNENLGPLTQLGFRCNFGGRPDTGQLGFDQRMQVTEPVPDHHDSVTLSKSLLGETRHVVALGRI